MSWLDDEARSQLLALLPHHIEVEFVQLMAGTFIFTAAQDYQAVLPDNVDVDFCDALIAQRHQEPAHLPLERHGLYGKIFGICEALLPDELISRPFNINKPHVVYGMGEFLDTPSGLRLRWKLPGWICYFRVRPAHPSHSVMRW